MANGMADGCSTSTAPNAPVHEPAPAVDAAAKGAVTLIQVRQPPAQSRESFILNLHRLKQFLTRSPPALAAQQLIFQTAEPEERTRLETMMKQLQDEARAGLVKSVTRELAQRTKVIIGLEKWKAIVREMRGFAADVAAPAADRSEGASENPAAAVQPPHQSRSVMHHRLLREALVTLPPIREEGERSSLGSEGAICAVEVECQ
jgi:hypothetical protein